MGMKMTRNYIESVIDYDGEKERYIQFYDTLNETLYAASKLLAFDDCCPVDVDVIVVEGREVKYCGWQPGMVYEFYDCETKGIVWSCDFPQWDH